MLSSFLRGSKYSYNINRFNRWKLTQYKMKFFNSTIASRTSTVIGSRSCKSCAALFLLLSVTNAFTSNGRRTVSIRAADVIGNTCSHNYLRIHGMTMRKYYNMPSLWIQKVQSRGSSSIGGGTSTVLQLFGKNFFGGGAYDIKIDYDTLDHPGPELAKLAKDGIIPTHSVQDPTYEVATFAGGCFWGMELAFQRIPGVIYTIVGYTQGKEEYPTYDQVKAGNTGHTEAVMIYYDPSKCTYEQLINCFFNRVDPTTINGQGNDYGRQYRTGVYFHTAEQCDIAKVRYESLVEKQEKNNGKRIATEFKPATIFWPAEKYHQQYLENGGRFGIPQSAKKGATDTIRCYG